MESTMSHTSHAGPTESSENIWTTYKPLFLVAAFIIGVTGLVEVRAGALLPMRAMDNFMAGFFIFFSFFKFLNLQAFADAFATYDVIAKRSRAYAVAYPFIELALGIAFVLGAFPVVANVLTVVLMAVGNYGVWLVLKRKGTIQCACLGTIFNLPMTKITLFENSLMMAMALASLSIIL
jgi:uncharacterized membrane protein YphA (DoxX/SURF4 family)